MIYQTGPSTQTRHPWRATLRTTAAAAVALLSLLPMIAATTHLDGAPIVVQVLGVSAIVTRVLAIPAVDNWLRRFVPALASTPRGPVA
jgi:hypothetical protein